MAKFKVKQLSITGMISMTLFLIIMDIRDLYYKIYMCGTYPTLWFILDAPEVVTKYDVTKAIWDAHGVWLSPTNMWNALASECDAFFPSKLLKKAAHLSSMGVNCTLGGIKHYDERMFIGSHRIDAFMWATGVLADAVNLPMVASPPTNALLASYFNVDEQKIQKELVAMVTKADIPIVQAVCSESSKRLAHESGCGTIRSVMSKHSWHHQVNWSKTFDQSNMDAFGAVWRPTRPSKFTWVQSQAGTIVQFVN